MEKNSQSNYPIKNNRPIKWRRLKFVHQICSRSLTFVSLIKMYIFYKSRGQTMPAIMNTVPISCTITDSNFIIHCLLTDMLSTERLRSKEIVQECSNGPMLFTLSDVCSYVGKRNMPFGCNQSHKDWVCFSQMEQITG